jgi:hypothetical protein
MSYEAKRRLKEEFWPKLNAVQAEDARHWVSRHRRLIRQRDRTTQSHHVLRALPASRANVMN